MKRPAEQEIKVLIAKVRDVCAATGDCPVAPARQPSQLDCIACILKDMDTIVAERNRLREVMAQVTEYGTTATKLEAAIDPSLVPRLKREIRADATRT